MIFCDNCKISNQRECFNIDKKDFIDIINVEDVCGRSMIEKYCVVYIPYMLYDFVVGQNFFLLFHWKYIQ